MPENTRSFQTISPVDGSVYVERPYAGPSQIEAALSQAKQAEKAWKNTSLSERAALCEKIVQYFENHSEAISEELTWQMGRPLQYTPFEVKGGLPQRARHMVSIAPEALADIQVESSSEFERLIRREPLGTVLVLAPWNYPYLTSVNAIIPALMAGNCVILKHATQTPLCAERYAEACRAAGLPQGVFQYLHMDHGQVAGVIGDARIDYVAFTGSVGGGEAVQRAIGSRFIHAGLELGGKDPAYVRADAKLDFAVENLVDGAFFNSGQSCCGIERIYVHHSVFDAFVEGFVSLTKKYVLGNPLDAGTNLGPMVRTSAASFIQKQIDEAIQQGAKAWIDPAHFTNHQAGTPYMAPQVLTNVDHSMAVMSEESFGPVVGIMAVRDDDEAIALMNDSQYGLTASIWTTDLERAMELGDQLQTGTCFMNRCDYLDPALAWTGVKNSGRGCTLSTLGYEALTRPKSFHMRK